MLVNLAAPGLALHGNRKETKEYVATTGGYIKGRKECFPYNTGIDPCRNNFSLIFFYLAKA
jgi:hypothetical protein